MKAIIISIGNELTSGQTIDTNSAYLAEQLGVFGIETLSHVTVGDDRAATSRAITAAADEAELVLVTGGLGPTADDLSRQALADAMGGVELVQDAASLAELEDFFSRRGRTMVDANRIQAMFPAGSRAIANACGTAPGIAARVGRAMVYVMPGVPGEMRRMFAERIGPELPRGNVAIVRRTLQTFGAGESDVGARIVDLMARDANPLVGTTVASGLIGIRLTSMAATPAEAVRLADATIAEITARLGDLVVGEGEHAMSAAVGLELRRRGESLATAESCTGGLIGEMITDVAGASDYYLGGIVSYANAVKRDLLGVGDDILAANGAVSEPVARAMAEGCRSRFGADWAVSATGIAGPSGGSAQRQKPVGLVYVGLCGPGCQEVHRHVLPGDRAGIRTRAALAALNHLRLALKRMSG
jgi:nicotinamide-nucleotide amidase